MFIVYLAFLAIKLNYGAHYPVTLSLPFHFGADNLKQEWCFKELFVFSVVIWHLLSGYLTCRCSRVILCQLNQSLAALDFDFRV